MMLDATLESAAGVLRAGQRVRSSLPDAGRCEYALERLAVAVENSLDIAPSVQQYFEAVGGGQVEVPVDEELGVVAAQLTMASVALSAEQVAGDLDQALDDLAGITNQLELQVGGRAEQEFQATRTQSPDRSTAVATLTVCLQSVLDAIIERSADLATKALSPIPGTVPWMKAHWQTLTEDLQLNQFGASLTRLAGAGLRLVAAALSRLAGLIPSTLLVKAGAVIENLADRLVANEPAVAVVGWVLNVDAVRAEVAAQLERRDLDVGRIDRATDALTELVDRHGKLTGSTALALTAVSWLHNVAAAIYAGVPQLWVASTAAHVFILSAVVLIGMEYLDTGFDLGFVVGVRTSVASALQ
ncbi:MAG: hypothetical protein EOP16_00440 [Pseudonocardia sp.]|nr:MAG: hypothetical protein EOP16_00440 [Pseudonocardia sp.]